MRARQVHQAGGFCQQLLGGQGVPIQWQRIVEQAGRVPGMAVGQHLHSQVDAALPHLRGWALERTASPHRAYVVVGKHARDEPAARQLAQRNQPRLLGRVVPEQRRQAVHVHVAEAGQRSNVGR